MNGTMSVELKQLLFQSHHGLYPEEKLTGNRFEVNLSVEYVPQENVIDTIENTVNYTQLYEIIKKEMGKPRDLLETIVMEIVNTIHAEFPQINKIDISIEKQNPPIIQFTGAVCVRFLKTY